MMPTVRRTAMLMGLVGVAYFTAALVGIGLSSQAAFATFWPPNGVLIAILLRSDVTLWPYLILATCPANLAAFTVWHHQPGLLGFAYWMANMVESVAAAGLLCRFHGRLPLDRPRQIVSLAAVAAFSTILGATIGAAATEAWAPATGFAEAWRSWWMSDLLGVLMVAPVILSLPGSPDQTGPARLSAECVAFAMALGVVVAVTVLAPAAHLEPTVVFQPLIVPLLGWAVLRLGVRGTSWALLVFSLLVVLNHVRGLGEFVGPAGYTPARAVVVQAVLSGLSVTFLCIAAALQETRASANRLLRRDESRQAFVTAMTHEIRNPIGVILASVEIADEVSARPGTPVSVDPLRAIEQAARQILEMVEDVLAASQVDADRASVQVEPVWLPSLWRDLHDQCRTMPRAPHVSLRWVTPVPDVSLMIDRKLLITVARNLVGNAFKFTDRGYVRVECRIDNDALAFLVKDTGIGVAVEDQRRIFELYQRGQGEAQRRPGTGIGLYLVRRHVEACGGTVCVTSLPGEGSIFTVILPGAIARSGAA